MNTIRVVSGTGTGPTAIAAYDAALADAGVHNYNLVRVSSVLPAGSTVEYVDTAPDLGPIGGKLTVVEARATSERAGTNANCGDDTNTACAGLGWTVDDDGRGLLYEASGTDPATVRETVAAGLAAGRDLREWSFTDERVVTALAQREDGDGTAGEFATAVVLVVYGDSEPIL